MEQGGNQDQLRVGEARPEFNAERVTATHLLLGEALQLQHYADGVFINGVGMEQVKLHLADNMRPLRHIGPEHTVTVHRQQPAAYRARMTQHAQKQRPRFGDIAQRLRQMTAGMAQVAQGGGVDPGDGAVTHHGVKHPQDRFRLADEQRLVTQVDQRAAQLKLIVDRARFFIGGQGEDRLIKQLQQHLVEFADPAGDAEEVLHHLLNRFVTLAAIVQALGDA